MVGDRNVLVAGLVEKTAHEFAEGGLVLDK